MRAVVAMLLAGCGRLGFDEVEPATLEYEQVRSIFVYNDVLPSATRPIPDLAPLGAQFFESFAIAPDLTGATGLDFDPDTGTISGLPARTSPVTVYTVTAVNRTGNEVSGTLSIRTAPGFVVDDLGDKTDGDLADATCASTDGGCTLRAAFDQQATFDRSGRLVLLPPGTITMTDGQLVVAVPTEIIGAGRGLSIVSASGLSRVFDLTTDNDVILTELTATGGRDANGGCITMTGGRIQMRRVAVRDCEALGVGGGAELSDQFGNRMLDVTIDGCVFADNVAGASGSTGGALATGSRLGPGVEITGTSFLDNRALASDGFGGAIAFDGGSLAAEGNLFARNVGRGGGISSQGGSTLELINNTFSANASPGNAAGAVQTNNDSTLLLVNNTIADNTCMTTCFNGAGIGQFTGGTGSMVNTILVNNRDLQVDDLANSNAFVTSLGNNVTDSAINDVGFAGPNDVFLAASVLEPLADNGGPTHTHGIAQSSPAFNAASTSSCPATDQRTFARPANGGCDAGAFELQ